MTPPNVGVLLTNIGTPTQPTPSAVRCYLKEFLSDRRVIELPSLLWWPILHGFILRTRPQRSAKLYQKIWTEQGSPLLLNTKKIAEKLRHELKIPVAIGMHYGNPSIPYALEELRAHSVMKILVLPLYPQYSATTTASTFDRVAQTFQQWRRLPALHMINHYADYPAYIQALAHSIQFTWETHGQAQHLLFSFHGIPKRYADAGDPYPQLCQLTANLVTRKLNLANDRWSIAYQSRLGRTQWLTPYTNKVLTEFPVRGMTHLQVICPGFAVDCLETLEEIAIRGKEQFLAAGGKSFYYIPALNDDSMHLIMLVKKTLI